MKLPEPLLPNNLPGLVGQLTRLWRQLQVLLATVDSGTYTPALTKVANLTNATAYPCQWQQVGSTVTVSGRVDVQPTIATNTVTTLGISLPVASNLTNTSNVGGTAVAALGTYAPAFIIGDLANQRASLQFLATGVANTGCMFQFSYQVA